MFVIFSVFYILIAAAMIVLILLQNGAGADAGSGFGGGASATVFGARGSSTFLTRATGVLAGLFFLLSLGMGIYLHGHGVPQTSGGGLGVMAGAAEKPAPVKATPAAAGGSEVPSPTPASAGKAVPAATPAATGNSAPAQSQGDVPAATPPATKKH
jgi:preprotein translocase subunit SecG